MMTVTFLSRDKILIIFITKFVLYKVTKAHTQEPKVVVYFKLIRLYNILNPLKEVSACSAGTDPDTCESTCDQSYKRAIVVINLES